MQAILIKNARIVNEGKITTGHVLCRDNRIEKIFTGITPYALKALPAKLSMPAAPFLCPGSLTTRCISGNPDLRTRAISLPNPGPRWQAE
jgi:hypothetical protein